MIMAMMAKTISTMIKRQHFFRLALDWNKVRYRSNYVHEIRQIVCTCKDEAHYTHCLDIKGGASNHLK